MLTALSLVLAYARPPVTVQVSFDGTACHVGFDGRPQVFPFDGRRLVTEFRRLKRAGRSIAFRFGSMDVPYRCVGLIIYTEQRAGVPMQMSFVAEPPPTADGP